jgi:hypothetical protein
MFQSRFSLSLLLSTILGCSAAPTTAAPPAKAKQWGIVNDEKLVELSGLAPYRGESDETLLWAHNDGPHSKLYLIDKVGDTRAILDIKGIEPVDCEDLGSFSIGDQRYLLLADTGDNNLRRKSCQLYLIEEPQLAAFDDAGSKKKKKNEKPPEHNVKPTVTIDFTFPGGPRNCEAVGVDTVNRLIVLVSKEKNPVCELFTLPLPVDDKGQLKAVPPSRAAALIGRVPVPTILGLTIDPQTGGMILLGREKLFHYSRELTAAPAAAGTYARMLKQGPKSWDKPQQKQGEAVCFSPDGKKLYLASEGKNQPIWEISLEK